jgi:DNA-binding response OmpR family regulator
MATVLVVDDEATIRDSLREALTMEGHRVLVASDGQEALFWASQIRPHLVILDLMMPVLDGWAFLRQFRLQPRYRATPVLVVSAYPNLPGTVETYGVEVVRKPFDLGALIGTVARLLPDTKPS